MFTSYDKAIAALIGPLLYLISKATGLEINLSEEMQVAIAGAISALLTWLIPNKPKEPATPAA